MYLIDESYFTREYSIPNINEMQSETGVTFSYYIEDKVRQFLQKSIGYLNFQELDSHILNGVLKNDAPQIWKDLVNGKEYDSGGQTLKWNGLLYLNGTFKKSLLVPFVFHEWLRESSTSNTGKVIQTANATNVSVIPRLTDAWNDFVLQYQQSRRGYLPTVQRTHNAVYVDFLFDANDNYVSMIRFLQDNLTSYDPFTYKIFPLTNNFGL